MSRLRLFLISLVATACARLHGRFDVPSPAGAWTSAGVRVGGRLLRTLWSRVHLPAGRHRIAWDARDDAGRLVALSAAERAQVRFHVLAFNITYTWEGVIGNSVGQTGPGVPKGYNPPQSLSIAGDVAVLANGYAERVRSMMAFNASPALRGAAASSFTSLGHMDYHRVFAHAATDGRIAAFANRSPPAPNTSYYYLNLTFVAAWDVGALAPGAKWCEHNFTEGGALSCEEGYGQAPCSVMWDGCSGHEQTYSSVIDVAHDPWPYVDGDYADAATGLAMQSAPGVLLLVAHGHKAALRAFHKATGAGLRAWTDAVLLAGVRSLATAAGAGAGAVGDVWAVTDSGVVLLRGLGAAAPLVAARALPAGAVRTPGALALSPDGRQLLVTDVHASSQQVKLFDAATGALLRAYGSAGGYLAGGAGGISVAPTRFWFSSPTLANAWGAMPVPASLVAWTADGASFWVSDAGNRRLLRIDASGGGGDGALLDSLGWLLCSYASAVPAAEPRRIFSNFLEFEADYSLPLSDPKSWTLVANWGAGLAPEFVAWDIGTLVARWAFAGFKSAATIVDPIHGINRTFAVVSTFPHAPDNETGSCEAVVELVRPGSPSMPLCPSSGAPGPGGGLRILETYDPAAFPAGAGTFEADGSLRYAETVNGAGGNWQAAYARAPAFDAAGCVRWAAAPPALLAAVNVSANNSESLMIRGSMTQPAIPTTAGGYTIFFDADRNKNGGMHLGAVLPAADGSPGRDWAWQASPWGAWTSVDNITVLQPGNVSVNLRYIDAATIDGRFGGDDPSVNFAGSRALALGAHVFYGFYGEGWQQSEANQALHFHETGLFLGQFGIPAAPYPEGNTIYATAGVAGNTFYPTLVRSTGADGLPHLYIHNNEEVEHGGVHRWRIDGADDVAVLDVVVEGTDDGVRAAHAGADE